MAVGLTSADDGRLTIPLDRLLQHGIEGYLFGDLESMATEIQPKELGAVGYPMVMAVLSGSELLGALTSKGGNRIETYWTTYMAQVDWHYEYLGKIAKKLARNGIAHRYLSHLGVLVQRGGDRHFMRFGGELVFDCLQLDADFRRSYTDYARPYILDHKDAAQSRLDALLEHDLENAKLISKLPPKLFPNVLAPIDGHTTPIYVRQTRAS
ncbi:MAG TPA: hypothetical protein VGL78_10920 [Solirubrobacteraceae bacterium]|jgi:hypothetical protein